MNVLRKAIDTIPVNKPVYSLLLTSGGKSISFTHIGKVNKGLDDQTPLNILIKANMVEEYKDREFVINRDDCYKNCLNHIKTHILEFMLERMPQKHPDETKIGMFYKNVMLTTPMGKEIADAMVPLYLYIKDNCPSQPEYADSEEQKHSNNAMKVLEFLFIKYGEHAPIKEPKRRKPRRKW